MVYNVAQRPPGEQRFLLNSALSELIERSISRACDDLDDGAIEQMLTSVSEVSYREKLRI